MQRSRVTLICFMVLMATLFVANFAMVASYLLAVVMGAILSLLFRRVYQWLLQGMRPSLAGILTTVAIASLVVMPIIGFALVAIDQAVDAAQYLASQPGLTLDRISRAITRWKPARQFVGDAPAVQEQIKETVRRLATTAPALLLRFFGSLPELVLQVVLALISCHFFLVDGGRLRGWLRDKLPLDPEVRATLFTSFRDTAVSAILATLTAAAVQAAILTVGFLTLGVPGAFLAGGATFVLAWIPLIGSTPVWLGGAIYLFADGSSGRALGMLGVGVLTGLSDNIIHPWVLKGKGELHPLVSLVAIFGGIHVFGLFGVFIGPILAALFVAVANIWPLVAERFGITNGSTIVKTSLSVLLCLPLVAHGATEPNSETSQLESTFEGSSEIVDEGGSSWVPIAGYNPVYRVFVGGGYFHKGSRHSFGVHGVGTFVDVYQLMMHWEQRVFTDWKYRADVEYSRGFEPFYGDGGDTRAVDERKIWGDKILAKPRIAFLGVPALELGVFGDIRSRGEVRVDGGAQERLFPNETTAGIGIYMEYDRRDHPDSPTDGYLLKTDVTYLPASFSTLGEAASLTQVEGHFTTYQEMIAGVVAAMRFQGGYSFGVPSYLFKYRLGGTDLLRGYYDNRFRGAKYYLQQTELRFPLPWVFEGAAFIGFGDAAEEVFSAPKMAYGAGLRIGLPPNYVSKIRIDAGFGKDQSGVFVDFGHAF